MSRLACRVQVSFELELKQAQARLAQQEAAAADLAAHADALQGQVAVLQDTLQVTVSLLCWLHLCMGGVPTHGSGLCSTHHRTVVSHRVV